MVDHWVFSDYIESMIKFWSDLRFSYSISIEKPTWVYRGVDIHDFVNLKYDFSFVLYLLKQWLLILCWVFIKVLQLWGLCQISIIYIENNWTKTLNSQISVSVCLIGLKLTVLIKRANKSLHTGFQGNLKFLKYLQILLIWYHRPILWTCLSPTKLKL